MSGTRKPLDSLTCLKPQVSTLYVVITTQGNTRKRMGTWLDYWLPTHLLVGPLNTEQLKQTTEINGH